MILNLNADLGESYGIYTIGNDEHLLQVVNSANVACGFHGGDAQVMAKTLDLASRNGVSIGAHPGFPDLQGFGRRPMQLSAAEIRGILHYQIGALEGIGRGAGARVTHVKPHGALNNMACESQELATAIAGAVRDYNRELILLAPALSELAAAGERAGLPVALEVFADRLYGDNGHLLPRSHKGAVLHNPEDCAGHVLRMVEKGGIVSAGGKLLRTRFHSICVHGDNAEAVISARRVRQELEELGVRLLPLPEVPG